MSQLPEHYNLRRQDDIQKEKSKDKQKVAKVAKKAAAPSKTASKANLAPTTRSKIAPNNMAASEPRTATSVSASDMSGISDSTLASDAASDRVLGSISELQREMRELFANNAQQVKLVDEKLSFVIRDINAVKEDLAETKKSVADLEASVNFTDGRLDSIEKNAIPSLKESLRKQEEDIEEKLLQMEIHQRKQNLLVYGIPDKANEDILATTRNILCHFLKVAPDEAARIPLINAHRLPRPPVRGKQPAGQQPPGQQWTDTSPIIIRFASMFHRDRVLHAYDFQPPRRQHSHQPQPQGSGHTSDPSFARVSIRSDLPAKLKKERGQLASTAYKLRREKRVSTRIKLNGTKLILQTRNPGRDGTPSTAWTTWSE